MFSEASPNITQILKRYSDGDKTALDELLPKVYDELRRLAGAYMRRESPNHTLQPTALVHEAYFRLVDQKNVKWQNRGHFFGIAAQMMRRILVDHARIRHAEKRGGKATKISFEEGLHWTPRDEPDILSLDSALTRLTELDERQGKVVELRYFGGLGVEETAEALGISPATVKRDWTVAKAWLLRELNSDG
jgi:RNA polymerase sigma-70 factor, ECF subfamily